MTAKNIRTFGLGLLVCTVLMPVAAWAGCTGNTNPNLLHNSNFESASGSTIPNWTVAVTPDIHVFVTTGEHEAGAQSLALGSIGFQNRIYQKIGGTVAGTVYTACFYLRNDGGSGSTRFQAEWNNQPKVALVNSAELPNWQYFEFTFLGTGNDVLGFEERNDPTHYYIDNVAVQECTSCAFSPNGLPQKQDAP